MRQRRSPARYIAPLALLATVAGVYLVVHSSLPAASKPARKLETGGFLTGQTRPPTTTATLRPTAPERTYVVRSGDTLDLIAARTGVSLQTLEALNPGVSSTELHVGQRLILRR